MDYKRLMKKYLYLLFCSIIMTLIFGYFHLLIPELKIIILVLLYSLVLHVALVQLLN